MVNAKENYSIAIGKQFSLHAGSFCLPRLGPKGGKEDYAKR